ncbi:PIN-like domain-containing protein [Streptomyces rugosispiralis]|uniref:PIN-like domain-containing protein n=1 Tax=Streptomyces rugosispiralis TaxID=2967341 RepID=A0ABT1UYD2_9ACTN|nr:PIN-like domain-containing protein [Streptomyces rugosispiralis]MCQ8190130.1 PIN-like domain-containing protein [Streptomyces rugosispiralis]
MTTGLIVLDTNVLLDLYRMNHRVRSDMLTVLESLRNRIWVPRQVVEEFWRNQQHDGLLGHHQDRATQAKDALSKACETMRQAVNRWANDVHLGQEAPIRGQLDEGLASLSRVIDEMSALIDRQAASDEVPDSADTNRDPVITRLESLLDGRVGPRMPEDQRDQAVLVAQTRATHKRPPGYRDFEKGKPPEEAAGDYLVWTQLLAEGRRRGVDVLFVTRDLKEDWWRKGPSGSPRQPRVELMDEMYEETAQRLFMLEPSSLMKQASRILSLEGRVDERSVRALEQLESVELGDGDQWSQESLEALVDLLLETADVQAQAILEAALNDGLISRERVYEIGGYDPSRMLRGFTRPVKTATRRLHDAGHETGDANELLVAVYDNGVMATGFRIPAYTVPILRLLAERVYSDADRMADEEGET